MLLLKQGKVTIDDAQHLDGYIETVEGGWTGWNGWARPWFTKEQGMEVARWVNLAKGPEYMLYNHNKDQFEYFAPQDDGDAYTWRGTSIEVDGEDLHLYAIGNGFFTWDRVEDEEKVS
jgi:hypothetical protein